MDNKKIIFLENEHQASEYLKNKEKFKDFLPIAFTFPVEKLLKENSIKFKVEGDYEKGDIYKNLNKSSINSAEKICENLEIRYRGVNLMNLFYHKLHLLLSSSKKNLRLLKSIIKTEKPEEVTVFESSSSFSQEEEFIPMIIGPVFKKGINVERYPYKQQKDVREKNIFKIISFLQKILTKIQLNSAKKTNKKIFIFGGETYFKSTISLLIKNKKNKIFNFNDCLRKSFFVGRKYLPFYEFSGKNSIRQGTLKKEVGALKQKIKNLDFSKEFGTEKELENILKIKLFNIIDNKFLWISKHIEEMNYLMGKRKVNLILLSENTSPFTGAIVKVARMFKIPSIVFLHGIPISYSTHTPIIADYIFIFGEKIIKGFIKSGTDKDKIKVIGCPRYDEFVKKRKQRKEKIILYAMEVSSNNELVPDVDLTEKRQKEILRMLFHVLKKFPEYKLIIKTKPYWDMAELPAAVAKQEKFNNLEIIEKTDNMQLLNDSEIVIINRTTMGLEALLLDKPVISISFKDLDKIDPYKEMECVDTVYTEKQLRKAIKGCLNQSKEKVLKKRADLKKYLLIDRKSSQRAVWFINKILKNKIYPSK